MTRENITYRFSHQLSSFMPFVIISSLVPALLVLGCVVSCLIRLVISVGAGQDETKRYAVP